MDEYKSQKELYLALVPALNVKMRIIRNSEYNYIKKEDIWNYLRTNKWCKDINLCISEMVNDIINVEEKMIDKYLTYRKIRSIVGSSKRKAVFFCFSCA